MVSKMRCSTFMKLVVSLLLAALIVLIILIGLIVGVWIWSGSDTIENLDADFNGVFIPLDPSKRQVHILIVHGIGSQCIGYSEDFVRSMAEKAHLEPETNPVDEITDYQGEACRELGKPPYYGQIQPKQYERQEKGIKLCQEIHENRGNGSDCEILKKPHPDRSKRDILGFLRTSSYRRKEQKGESVVFRVYELVWDPTTTVLKNRFLHKFDVLYSKKRDRLNRLVKRDVIHDSIADAALYMTIYKKNIQLPVIMAMCGIMKFVTGIQSNYDKKAIFLCKKGEIDRIADKLNKSPDLLNQHEIAFVSHSLGSRIIFDTLGLISKANFPDELTTSFKLVEEINADKVIEISKAFQAMTSKIFALANQVPLLTLTTLSQHSTAVDIGDGFQEFLKARAKLLKARAKLLNARTDLKNLQLITFTERNDILNYDLKCWYFLSMVRYTEKTIKMKENHYLDKCEGIVSQENFCDDLYDDCKDYKDNDTNCKAIGKKAFTDVCERIIQANQNFGVCKKRMKYWEATFDDFAKPRTSEENKKLVRIVCKDKSVQNCKQERRIVRKIAFHTDILVRDKLGVYRFNSCSGSSPDEEEDLKNIWEAFEKKNKLQIINVTVNLADWIRIPEVYAHFPDVHSNYWGNDEIHKLIACGGSLEEVGSKECN